MAPSLRHALACGVAVAAVALGFPLAPRFAVAGDCESACAARRKECDAACFKQQQECALQCPLAGPDGVQGCLANCAAKGVQCGAVCIAHDEGCKVACRVPPPPPPRASPPGVDPTSRSW
jgi:hypothetical protein